MESQHTLAWFRKRLGNITGSELWKLMGKGRNKNDMFSETAKTYIYQLSAERDMNPVIIADDELFEEYLKQVDITSKAMRWGNEQEGNARELYEKLTKNRIVEVGSCTHPTIKHFASSPDGYYAGENGEKGCVEIKCTSQSTYMRYKSNIKNGAYLFAYEQKYFFQCQAHIMCLNADWCDFVVYNPFQNHPIHIARILPYESMFGEIESRIVAANEIIEKIINDKY